MMSPEKRRLAASLIDRCWPLSDMPTLSNERRLFVGLCCKTLFGSPKTNFPGCRHGDRTIVRGTAATGDELTGNFGSALEDTSIGDCRLVALFAEKSLQAIFGVLQHYPWKSGSDSDIAKPTRMDPEPTWAGPASVWRIRRRAVGYVEDSDCGTAAGRDGEEGASCKN
jgi:hypothetical protein